MPIPRDRFLPRAAALCFLILGAATRAPLSAATGDAASPPSGMVAIPMVPATFNHYGIAATLNGHPLLLTIDTGAPLTAIDTRAYQQDVPADAIKAMPEQVIHLTSLNHQTATTGWAQDLQAGGMHFGSGPVAVTDLSHVSGARSSDYREKTSVGILGTDILAKYAAIIDWRRRVVYFFTDPSRRGAIIRAAVNGGWTAVPMAYTGGRHFTVPCNIGDAANHLVVDTGAAYTMLDKSIWAGRDVTRGQPRMYMGGISGIEAVSPIIVKNWYIGKFQLQNTPVVVGDFHDDGMFHESTSAPGRIVGILGSEWLHRSSAIIDVNGMTLYLKRPGA